MALLTEKADTTRDGLMRTTARHESPANTPELGQAVRHEQQRNAMGDRSDQRRSAALPARLDGWWAAWRGHRCPEAMIGLVRHYMKRHVQPIAERLAAGLPSHVDVDDLVQQGYLGLVDAMERFDTAHGVRFETFSSRRISGAMRDWLRSLDHVPRLMRRRAKIVQQEQDRFRAVHGRTPDQEELRAGLDLEGEEFHRVVSEAKPPVVVTISAVSNDDEDDPVSVPSRSRSGPSTATMRRDLRQWITRDLEPVDRLIVSMYYYESLTMREIGVALGCSESRVSQRLDSILQRLRARVDITPEHLRAIAG